MEPKPGTPEPDQPQQHSDEDELEDLKAPAEDQEEVAGGCANESCAAETGCFNTHIPD
ncbi:MAG: hypothetical protein JOZ07_06870 [Solirubrobacterales bacterium]|nr:hypothetical protein [Solirubrobacterales bacterium]